MNRQHERLEEEKEREKSGFATSAALAMSATHINGIAYQ